MTFNKALRVENSYETTFTYFFFYFASTFYSHKKGLFWFLSLYGAVGFEGFISCISAYNFGSKLVYSKAGLTVVCFFDFKGNL